MLTSRMSRGFVSNDEGGRDAIRRIQMGEDGMDVTETWCQMHSTLCKELEIGKVRGLMEMVGKRKMRGAYGGVEGYVYRCNRYFA